MVFEIYTDGSSYSKGKNKCSSAAYILCCNDQVISTGGAHYSNGTNNKGEVMAVLLGLRDLDKRLKRIDTTRLRPPYNVRIIGDSLLTIEGCRSWIYTWLKKAKNGILINSSNEPVINGDIFRDIHKKYTSNDDFNITYLHVNSHILEHANVKNPDTILKYLVGGDDKSEHMEELINIIYRNKHFKDAMDTYVKKNKCKIAPNELLRMLIYNKKCDELAYEYLNNKTKK